MRRHNDLDVWAVLNQPTKIADESVLKLRVEMRLRLLDQNCRMEEFRVEGVCIRISGLRGLGEPLPRGIGKFVVARFRRRTHFIVGTLLRRVG